MTGPATPPDHAHTDLTIFARLASALAATRTARRAA